MRRLLGTAVVLTWLGASLAAQQGLSTYEQLSVTGTAVGITAAVRNPAGGGQMTRCEVRVEGTAVRFRDDGTDPTTDLGSPLDVADVLTVSPHERVRAIRFIRSASSGTASLVNIRCYP